MVKEQIIALLESAVKENMFNLEELDKMVDIISEKAYEINKLNKQSDNEKSKKLQSEF